MLAMILGAIQSIVSGIAGPLIGYLGKREDVSLDGFKTAAGIDAAAYQAHLNAEIEIARLRASANSWMGARIMVFAFGLPAALHWSAVFLDSTFRFGWAVPALPGQYAGAEMQIALSFFIVAPAMPIISATAAWLGRKGE